MHKMGSLATVRAVFSTPLIVCHLMVSSFEILTLQKIIPQKITKENHNLLRVYVKITVKNFQERLLVCFLISIESPYVNQLLFSPSVMVPHYNVAHRYQLICYESFINQYHQKSEFQVYFMAFFLHPPYLRNHKFMNLFSYYFIIFSSCNFSYCYISFILGSTVSLLLVVDIFFILLLPSLPSHIKMCNKK